MGLVLVQFTLRNKSLRIVNEKSAELIPEISTQYEEARDKKKVGNQIHDDAILVISRGQVRYIPDE